MPELPEVEFTRRNLQRWLGGATIARVSAPDARIVKPTAPNAFARRLRGQHIEQVERRGKWIRIGTEAGLKLFVHLGMTGWFEQAEVGAPPLRFERAHFDLVRRGRHSRVVFTDSRRWGRLVLERADTATWSALGPDPLSDGIDVAALERRLARSKTRTIKEALLDQTALAGVGNIQAIEALWRARIDPRSRANALRRRQLQALVRAMHWTIERTLKDLALGEAGAKNPFKIYGHKGEPCPCCRTTLAWLELAGRTTTFCPGCQIRHDSATRRVMVRAEPSRADRRSRTPRPRSRSARTDAPRHPLARAHGSAD
jgi:formamidopyrimidine-DNA glycosylase